MENKVRFANTNLMQIGSYALQQQITNPDNWKKTREKQFEAWMAYSWSGIRFEVKQKNGDILQYDIGDMGSHIYKVAICTYFRTIFNIDIAQAAREYVFETGEAVSAASIERKRYGISLDWTKVKKIPNSEFYAACFIPKKITGYIAVNNRGALSGDKQNINIDTGHGDGDYIVAKMINENTIDIGTAKVINGRIFPFMYDLRNIDVSAKVKEKMATAHIEKPPSLDKVEPSLTGDTEYTIYWPCSSKK